MTDPEPTLASLLDALRDLGVVRARVLFDDEPPNAEYFAVSFRNGPRERPDELQRILTDVAILTMRVPGDRDDPLLTGSGELTVDPDAGTIDATLLRSSDEMREERIAIDLAEGVRFGLQASWSDEFGVTLGSDGGAWHVEWSLYDDRAEELLVEGVGEDLQDETDDEVETATSSADPRTARSRGDRLRLEALELALTALSSAHAARATVEYTSGTWATEEQRKGKRKGTRRVRVYPHGLPFPGSIKALFGESAWDVERLEANGRTVLADDPLADPLMTIAAAILGPHGDGWNGDWSGYESHGRLDVDIAQRTAALTHWRPFSRTEEATRVDLRVRDLL